MVEAECRIISQELRDGSRMLVAEQERRLVRRSRINDEFDLRPGHRRFNARLDFLERLHR
jgi:hypothetical protein